MSKSIRVLARDGGALRDTTVGKVYPIFAETQPGEVCPDGLPNDVEPGVVGLSFIDDVGDTATVCESGDPQAASWELVTE
jgi:hypothetical protein